MTEMLFHFDAHNVDECQMSYRGPKNQEYYLGDYSIDAGSFVDVKAERLNIGGVSVVRNQSNARQSFRRTQTHIRQDATDITVFWFVSRGHITFSHQSEAAEVGKGDMLITKSLTPFFMDHQTDDASEYEVYQVIVPTHALKGVLADDVLSGVVLPASTPEIILVKQIVTYLFEANVSSSTSGHQPLIDSALGLLGRALGKCEYALPTKKSISDDRFYDIERFINAHISNPNLNMEMVSEGCGISLRYTFHLLKSRGQPFSSLVWGRRLKMAANLIGSFGSSEMLISEIAYRTGFKSAAHFSRLFKRTYKLSPSEYRGLRLSQAKRPPLN